MDRDDAVIEEVANLPEGGLVSIHMGERVGEDHVMIKVIKSTLTEFADHFNEEVDHGRLICIVGLIQRPGTSLFFVTLEQTYFSPTGPNEPLYIASWARWNDMIWSVVVIPGRFAWTLESVAWQTGMSIARGCPMIIMQDKHEIFPIRSAWTLEGISKLSNEEEKAKVQEFLAKKNP